MNTNIEHAESMILYYSAYEAVCYIPDEKLQLEALKGLLEYGFRGVKPQSDNPFVNMVYAACTPSMKAAKQRYAKTIIDGKKGGRPSEMSIDDIMAMRRAGMSNKEIADSFGVTVKAVEARITRYNQDNPTNPINPTNLTLSYTSSTPTTSTFTPPSSMSDNKNIPNPTSTQPFSSTQPSSNSDTVHENEKENGIEVGDDFPFNDDEGEEFDGNPVFDKFGSKDNSVQYDEYSSGEDVEDGDLPF